jgi:hypothetical protein
MFTDLEDSSAMKTRLGDLAYAESVAKPHNAIFRSILSAVPGAEENNYTGDGFLATFPRASDAVEAARSASRALRMSPSKPDARAIAAGTRKTRSRSSSATFAACSRLREALVPELRLQARHLREEDRQAGMVAWPEVALDLLEPVEALPEEVVVDAATAERGGQEKGGEPEQRGVVALHLVAEQRAPEERADLARRALCRRSADLDDVVAVAPHAGAVAELRGPDHAAPGRQAALPAAVVGAELRDRVLEHDVGAPGDGRPDHVVGRRDGLEGRAREGEERREEARAGGPGRPPAGPASAMLAFS